MILPAGDLSKMTFDELVAAYVKMGFSKEKARAYVEILRGPKKSAI